MNTSKTPRRAIIIVGIVSLLLGLASQLPASVALNWVLPANVETRNITGSIWKGSANAIRSNGVTVGPVSWRIKPLSLLTGKVGASIEAGVPGGFFNGDVSVGRSRIIVKDARALFALEPLTRLSTIGPSQGNLRLAIVEARFDDLWPSRVEGELQLTDLRYPPVGQQPLGSYNIRFDPAEATDPAFPVAGQLESLSGPFRVEGTLKLGAERAYSMRAKVAATDSADTQMRNALRVLGPAQADGSHQLEFDGSL